MNRVEFQQLAEVRLREAEALLAAGLWDGAYYLAGYAVECGLKACIAGRTSAGDFPPSPEECRKYYTHDLAVLRKTARLDGHPDFLPGGNRPLQDNWRLCVIWKETVRYGFSSDATARELVAAVGDPVNGMLTWLSRHW